MEQLLIILGLTYACELIVDYTGLQVPGSVVGMLVLFALLKARIIKLGDIEEGASSLLDHLPIIFVPLGVGIYQYVDLIKDNALKLVIILVLTTIFVMITSGWTVQYFKRKAGERDVV